MAWRPPSPCPKVPQTLTRKEPIMPTSEDPKQEESIKDQPASPDLEITTEEIELEDADSVAGGGGFPMHGSMT